MEQKSPTRPLDPIIVLQQMDAVKEQKIDALICRVNSLIQSRMSELATERRVQVFLTDYDWQFFSEEVAHRFAEAEWNVEPDKEPPQTTGKYLYFWFSLPEQKD